MCVEFGERVAHRGERLFIGEAKLAADGDSVVDGELLRREARVHLAGAAARMTMPMPAALNDALRFEQRIRLGYGHRVDRVARPPRAPTAIHVARLRTATATARAA